MKARIYSSGKGVECKASLVDVIPFTTDDTTENNIVNVFPQITKQEIIGFGGALTESSAFNYSMLGEQSKKNLVRAYFDPEQGLGYNFCRLSIHSCDFSPDPYTYVTDNDASLDTFSVEHDEQYLFPLIRDAKNTAGTDRLTFFSSPWSPPAWMKDSNNLFQGGRLLPEYSTCWAEYIARYILEYKMRGIRIAAVTVQNEPKAAQSWESCQYTAKEEAEFAVQHLKPVLDKHGLDYVHIILWDHNKERLYERAIDSLAITHAEETIWGFGFHWYSGTHFEQVALTADVFPNKKLIATEFCIGGRDGLQITSDDALRYAQELSGDLNNGACACVDWNILLDETGGPYHNRSYGCKAPVVYDKNKKILRYTPIFYAIGHFSSFIQRGAVRIGCSSFRDDLLCTAVRNPDGRLALVLTNTAAEDYSVNIRLSGNMTKVPIQGKSMLTLIIEE